MDESKEMYMEQLIDSQKSVISHLEMQIEALDAELAREIGKRSSMEQQRDVYAMKLDRIKDSMEPGQ